MLALATVALFGFACDAAAATRYISPAGTDRADCESPRVPCKTWNYVLSSRRTVPGDTVIAKEGTYSIAAGTGLIDIDCAAGYRDGAPGKVITVRAEKEREALLSAPGSQPALSVRHCSYWTFVGFRIEQIDSKNSRGHNGHGVLLYQSSHVTLRRLLVYGNNRFWNTHAITLHADGHNVGPHATHNVIEENEVYFFHRHGISLGPFANFNIVRRNYIDSRGAADVCANCNGDSRGQDGRRGDEGIDAGYPGHDNIVENNIVNDVYIGIVASNAKSIASEPADRNQILGNVVLNATIGFTVSSRGWGVGRTPHDTLLTNNVVLGGGLALAAQGADNTIVIQLTARDGAKHGLVADHDVGTRENCTANTLACGDGTSSTYCYGCLIFNYGGAGFRIVSSLQEGGWGIDHSNAYNNSANYSPASSAHLTNSTTIDPSVGACKLWIPATSAMKDAGRRMAVMAATATSPIVITSPEHGFKSGHLVTPRRLGGSLGAAINNKTFSITVRNADAFELDNSDGRGLVYSANGIIASDKGANILYRYHNGKMTSARLWDPATGGFAAGGIVRGVNDVPDRSAFDLASRLNINTKGCSFPPGYLEESVLRAR